MYAALCCTYMLNCTYEEYAISSYMKLPHFSAVLYVTGRYSLAQYITVQYTARYSALQYCVQHDIVQYSIQHSTLRFSTLQYSALQHSTVVFVAGLRYLFSL